MQTTEEKARAFLALKRIAVAGVSQKRETAANGIYRKLKKQGYTVFPVHPNLQAFDDDPCYPDVKSIPEKVEGVVIVTSPAHTDQIVRDCAAAGITSVWMHQSLPRLGSSVSQAAITFCRENGIEAIAGACPMMFCEPVDIAHKCILWWLRVSGKMPAAA